ncbi:extracellular matrix/biofilm biosynthesis regulator RemA family protein [Chloroflexota bacterium]
MTIELVHVGFDNFLAIDRVIAIATVNSEPIRRVIQEAKTKGLLVDMTHGRKTKAVIFLDNGHIILVALATETIAGRLQSGQGGLVRPEQSDGKGEP